MTSKERARLLRGAASAMEHGRHMTASRKLDAALRYYVLRNPLRDNDDEVAVMDRALDAAEDVMRPLLARFKPDEIADSFASHIHTHLASELANIKSHGHKGDDPDDIPPLTDRNEHPNTDAHLAACTSCMHAHDSRLPNVGER